MKIEINDIPKLSFNKYNHLHWAKKKAFKDNLRLLLISNIKKQFKGGYSLNFDFYFTGRRLDTINVVHYCKIIEDYLFKQDKDNRQICINVYKGNKNKCILTLKKL
jgi:hypothetical protein